jgi:hypothetical protein
MLAPDGKMRLTDVTDNEQLFRLLQSIPSPKVEPFNLWFVQITRDRLDEFEDPELTDIISQTLSGKTTKEYKQFVGLNKENLHDNMLWFLHYPPFCYN